MVIAPEVIHKQQELLGLHLSNPISNDLPNEPTVTVGAQVLICYLGLLLSAGIFFMIYLRICAQHEDEVKLMVAGPSDSDP